MLTTPARLISLFLCMSLSAASGCATDNAAENADIQRRIMGLYDPGISDRFNNEGLSITPFDLNNDNTADMWKVFIPTQKHLDGKATIRLVRKEIDSNFDNRVDVWLLYNDQELLKEQHSDTNFDGVVDQRELLEKGQLVRRESYQDGFIPDSDAHPVAIKHYKSGKLFKIELDPDANGLINRWEIFIGGRLTQVGHDRDGDGRVDYWENASQPASP